jgi:hypothetical protein
MGQWKRLESPKLRVPLELRETTSPGSTLRIWEVQELRAGAVFKVNLDNEDPKSRGRSGKPLSDAGAERAVCLAVEEALLQPPDKEPGITYEISVTSEELAEAVATTG